MFYFVKYTPIMLGDYQYPGWGEALGFMISGSSMIFFLMARNQLPLAIVCICTHVSLSLVLPRK